MKKSSILLLFLVLLFATRIYSQTATTEKRVEFEKDDGFGNVGTFNFGKDGLLIISSIRIEENEFKEFHFSKFNTELEKVGESTIEMDKKENILYSIVQENRLYILCVSNKIRDKRTFSLIDFDYDTEKYNIVKGAIDQNYYSQSSAIVINDWCVCNVRIHGLEHIMAINSKTAEVKFIPVLFDGIKQNRIVFSGLQLSENGEGIFSYFWAKKKNKCTYSMFLDKDLNERKIILSNGENEILNSVTTSKISENENIIMGTYGLKIPGKSTGIYFALTENETVKNITFHNFTKFNNFFNFLSDKSQNRIEKKIDRIESKGKDVVLLYNMSSHNVIKVDEDFLYVGEAYYPTYHYENTTTYVNGKSSTTSTRVFDGYKYTHAVCAKFNKSGELLWDQCFELNVAETPLYVKQYVRVGLVNQNKINLVYSDGTKIYNKIIDYDGKTISEEASSLIESNHEGDVTKYIYSQTLFWYDNYYVNFGSQKIKNVTDEDVKRKRIIYFVNKIKF